MCSPFRHANETYPFSTRFRPYIWKSKEVSAPSIEKDRTMDSVGSWTNGQGRARGVILQRLLLGGTL